MDDKGWPLPLELDLAPDQIISGKAFSVAFRAMALLLVEGVAWWAYVLWSNGKQLAVAISCPGVDVHHGFLCFSQRYFSQQQSLKTKLDMEQGNACF
jgi:hypothetical protein